MQKLSNMDRWEQRENLSLNINAPVSEQVKLIVRNIIKNKDFTWDNLSFEDEAIVQQQLRYAGLDLRCYGMNDFPSSTREIYPLVIYITPTHKKFNILSITNLYNKYSTIILALTVAAGLGYYQTSLLAWALLYAWLVNNLMFVVMHEYWAHNYIEPRNKIIGYMFDVYMCSMLMFCDKPRKTAKIHDYHHRYFHSERDNIQYNLDHTHWLNYIFRFNVITDPKLDKWIHEQSDLDFVAVYKKMDTAERFLENHANVILSTFHLVLLLVLGLHLYIYFMLLPILMYKLVFFYFSEVLTHKVYRDDRDMPWAFPIVCNTAWHNTHHLNLDKLVLGPGVIKYFNPQYYFIRIFYRIKAQML